MEDPDPMSKMLDPSADERRRAPEKGLHHPDPSFLGGGGKLIDFIIWRFIYLTVE